MQTNATQRQWGASLLLFIFLAMWSLKMGHAFLAHQEHASRPVCEAAYEHNGVHLHDARYAAEDCSICAFVPAIPEIFSISVWLTSVSPLAYTTIPSLYETRHDKTAFDTTSLRGPPAI